MASGERKRLFLRGKIIATHGAKVHVKFIADFEYLKIFLNGKHLHKFDYRGLLKTDSINDISFKWEGDAAKASSLIAFGIEYKST